MTEIRIAEGRLKQLEMYANDEENGEIIELITAYRSLLTTIESQKEEIERMGAVNQHLEIDLVESKAITELAVKGLKFYADESNNEIFDGYGERIESKVDVDDGDIARSALSEIEKLQK